MFLSIYEIPHKRKYARWAWGLAGSSWRRSTMSRPWWTGCFVRYSKDWPFVFFARFLLKLGDFFVIVYTCFTITVGVFPGASDDSISDLKRMEKDLPKEANIDHKGEQRVAEGILGELHIIAGVFNLLQVRHYKEDFRKQCHRLKTFSRFTKRFLEFAQYGSFCMFIKTCVYPARPCHVGF